MNWFSQKLHSVRIIMGISLVLLASLSNNLAGAQQLCADLFEEELSFGLSLQKVNGTNEALLAKFEQPNMLTVSQLNSRVRQLEKDTENFLTAAGISFTTGKVQRNFSELKDSTDYILEYNIYQLHGSQTGSPLSRLIYGAEMHPEAKGANLTFGLDPLFRLNFRDSSAEFNPHIKFIMIGQHEFSENVMATGSNLRHEIQHFFEQMKMIKGKGTLARIQLESLMRILDGPYSQMFRADEIETHLRDLRYLSNAVLTNKNDNGVVELGFSPDYIPTIREGRKGLLNYKKEDLQMFINQLREAITEIETQLGNQKTWYRRILNPQNGDLILSFFKSGHYGNVIVNLNGMVKEADLTDNAKLREAVLEVLNWSRQRMDTIERELQRIEARSNP